MSIFRQSGCGFGNKSCCVCSLGIGCLSGKNEDNYIPASKIKVIENLDNNYYPDYRKQMIQYLKEEFCYNYIEKPIKESLWITKQ